MRSILALTLIPAPALAHVGHLGEVAGHGHWIAGAALGGAVLALLWAAWRGAHEAEESPGSEAEGARSDETAS